MQQIKALFIIAATVFSCYSELQASERSQLTSDARVLYTDRQDKGRNYWDDNGANRWWGRWDIQWQNPPLGRPSYQGYPYYDNGYYYYNPYYYNYYGYYNDYNEEYYPSYYYYYNNDQITTH